MFIKILTILIFFTGLSGLDRSASADTIDEYTPGYHAMKFNRRSNVWSQLDLVVFDGSITTNPPGTVKYDRRIQAYLNTGADFALGNNGVRFALKGIGSFEKTEEDTEPKTPTTQFLKKIKPAFDFTFVNHKGLEMFIGAEYNYELGYEKKVMSDLFTQTSTFGAAGVNVVRFGMMRRGGSWNGGVYYVKGASVERAVTLEVEGFSDKIETEETIQVPPELGIVASFNFYGFKSEMDFAMVQASESPDSSTDGINIVDDYIRVRFASYIPIVIGTLGASLTHQTFSYASNAFVTLDTIPRSILKVKYLLGDLDSHFFVGGIYSFGDDGLSIPETNETFELDALGVTTGFFFAF